MAAKQRRRKKRERTSEQDSKSCVQKLANIPQHHNTTQVERHPYDHFRQSRKYNFNELFCENTGNLYNVTRYSYNFTLSNCKLCEKNQLQLN